MVKLVHRPRELCRHTCGCVDGAGATYLYHVSHEAKHSKHAHCAEKGLECAKLLSAVDDREARAARQAEQLQQYLDGGWMDEDDEDEEVDGETGEDMDGGSTVDGLAEAGSNGAVCPHICGMCKKAGRFMLKKSVNYHQKSELLHPMCREAGLACSQLLNSAETSKSEAEQLPLQDGAEDEVKRTTTTTGVTQPDSSPSVGRDARSNMCRHTCSCLAGEGKLYANRWEHEKSRMLHPLCAAKGLPCHQWLLLPAETEEAEARTAPQDSETQQHVPLASDSAKLQKLSKRHMPCLHRTGRCNTQCQKRFTTAHEAVQHAASEHKQCACGGRKPKTWKRLAEKWMKKQEQKEGRRQQRREAKDKRASKKRRDSGRDGRSDHSSSPPSFPQSQSSASTPTSPYSGPSLFDPSTQPFSRAISLQPPALPPLPAFSNQSLSFPAVPLSAISAAGAGLLSRLLSPSLGKASFVSGRTVLPVVSACHDVGGGGGGGGVDKFVRGGGMIERFGVVLLHT